MMTKTQNQTPAVCDELERLIYELYRQWDDIGVNVATLIGKLERKGKHLEAEKIWQVTEDLTIKYVQKLGVLKKELDVLEKKEPPGKYGYMTIIGDLLQSLQEERTGESHLPDRNKPAYYAKIKELLTVAEERNQVVSDFFTKISHKYASLDSLPDVPVPNLPTALRDFKQAFMEAWEEYQANSPSALSSHSSVRKTTKQNTLR